MMKKLLTLISCLAVFSGIVLDARAQWQTQSVLVKPGWTAVFLHVDASYTNLDYLVGGDSSIPIDQIWMWQPTAVAAQFVTTPLQPITGSSQWSIWGRIGSGLGTPNTLATLAPNAAFLIHSVAPTNYTWRVKGKPVTPTYLWNITGINLIGFPTVTNNPPMLDDFLSLIPPFQSAADFYQYIGGPLSSFNPSYVYAPHAVPVTRGEAFWINSSNYFNTYFGPFQVDAVNSTTDFGDSKSRTSFHLRNRSASAVTVQLRLAPSEPPPDSTHFQAISNVPPLAVRGSLNTTNLSYTALNLTTTNTLSWTLPPQGQSGSDIVIMLGVNRIQFGGVAGSLYAGILKFTDSYGFTEVDVPVSASPANYAGLWVGSASVSQVSNYLKTYQRDENNTPMTDSNGEYIVTGVNTNLGATAKAFPLRLILHNDGTNVLLLQRAFYGQDAGAHSIITTSESLLDPTKLGAARRITAAHLPWTPDNKTWKFTGALVPGGTLSTLATIQYDDQAANPFLHTYHPDHDNLNATFQNQLPIGSESYQIDRQITLSLLAPGNDYNAVTQYGQVFSGSYLETVTLTGIGATTRTFNVAGAFAINKISPVAVLSRP